jgi:hypothetical protein
MASVRQQSNQNGEEAMSVLILAYYFILRAIDDY